MSEAPAKSIIETTPRSAAGIAAFRDHDAVRAALQAVFGVAPPTSPGFVQTGGVMVSCLSPRRYFVTAPRMTNLADSLTKSLAGIAAITDQSDLWTGFTLAGPGIRESLARIVPIDLTPQEFRVGALALTRAGHLDVRLWRVTEHDYELSVGRSLADDMRHMLGVNA